VNGDLVGSLGDAVTEDDLPACGLSNDPRTLAVELWPDTYYWHAHAKDGKMWEGRVTVSSAGCGLTVIGEGDLATD
jgi:hypothetical protein